MLITHNSAQLYGIIHLRYQREMMISDAASGSGCKMRFTTCKLPKCMQLERTLSVQFTSNKTSEAFRFKQEALFHRTHTPTQSCEEKLPMSGESQVCESHCGRRIMGAEMWLESEENCNLISAPCGTWLRCIRHCSLSKSERESPPLMFDE